MATEKKITKAMKFADVRAILNGEQPTNGCSIDELTEFIENEIALLAKKNSPNSKAKLEKEGKNAEYKQAVLEVMTNEPDRLFTATDIYKELIDVEGINNTQRVTYLLGLLIKDGVVIKDTDKRKSVYKLA